MKKFVVLILILTIVASITAFMPVISADEEVVPSDIASTTIGTTKLNEPIYDDINYYINIKSPSIFATYGKVLAVVQGDDILVKIDRDIMPIEGAGKYVDGSDTHKIKSITIDQYVDKYNYTYGYIYLTYINNNGSYITKIHKYTINNITGNELVLIPSFEEYIKDRAIDNATAEIINNLNQGAAEFSFINDTLYILSKNKMSNIYKIYKNQISQVEIGETSQPILNGARLFAANQNGDIYLYGYPDRESILFKKASDSNELKNVLEYNGIIDIVAEGNKVYLLTKDKLLIRSNTDATKKIIDFSLDGKEFLAFNVAAINNNNFISFAVPENDNILTYRESMDNGVFSLKFYNHYGANCTCKTPHQGWFNAPTSIVANSDESIVYVLDNYNNRLVTNINDKTNHRYISNFYDASKININNGISAIGIDRHNLLYLASGNKVYKYKHNANSDKDVLPFNRQSEITGFDGNIVDIKVVNRNESTIYILTSSNSVYSLSETSTTPTRLVTFGDKVNAFSPSYRGDRLYIASNSTIKSYNIDSIDITKPLTTLVTDGKIIDFTVDNAGNVFPIFADNTFRYYKRNEDNSYKLGAIYKSNKLWQHLSSFYVSPTSKTMYFTDSSLHIAEKYTPKTSWGYVNENDQYIDNNNFDRELGYVAKTTAPTKIYNSPVNFESYRVAEASEYFYVLAVDKNNKDMYLVVDNNNEFKYIKKDALTKVEATTDSIYGSTFVPLHSKVNIYNYPFENGRSEAVATHTGQMLLVDNVAYENDTYVWQNSTTKWFKVTYINEHNLEMTGYVKMREISKTARTTAPATKVHLRVKTKAGETVNMYDMPDLASGILMKGIINGTLVRLAEEEFNPDSEFTRVELEKEDGTKLVGYILTANLQKDTFTTLQIVAVVVTLITVLITILVVVLIVQYKKKRNSTNNFKNDDSANVDNN